MAPSDSHRGSISSRAAGPGATVADAVDATASAANLALQMTSAFANIPDVPAATFLMDLGNEFPATRPLLISMESIRERVRNSKSNREGLSALRDRCTCVTACVIVKRRCCSFDMDLRPLLEQINEVKELVRRCSTRGRVGRAMRADVDRRDVADLHGRMNDLAASMDLTAVSAVEEKLYDLKKLSATLNEKHQSSWATERPDIDNKKRSNVPVCAPARQRWHVTRQSVVKQVLNVVCEGLRHADRRPRVIGLVGDSGSGKTTAASELVRSVAVREVFSDGIVWLDVGKGANVRLRSLIQQLAGAVHEVLTGSKAESVPSLAAGSEKSCLAYIKETIAKGDEGRELRCLLVADDVWDAGVISKLRETGMWILVTTRQYELVKSEDGEAVRVDQLSKEDADAVLRGAAEIPTSVRLPDAARDLIELCGNVAMDVAFVGRWNSVCGREDRLAWSDAAASIRMELDADEYDATGHTCNEGREKVRAAVLRAGFDELGAEGHQVQWLYLALAVMPDAHAFSIADAAALLYDRQCDMADVEVCNKLVRTLERWSVLRAESPPSAVSNMTRGWWRSQMYRMHAAHSSFARESLMDRVDVLGPAVKRWVKHISSPDGVKEISPVTLVGLWRAVERVGGDGWRVHRPYEAASAQIELQAQMEGGRSICSGSVQSALRATQLYIDRKDWNTAFAAWSRALDLVPPCTSRLPVRPSSVPDPSRVSAELIFEKLVELGWCAWEAGRTDEAVALTRKGAQMGEAKLGPDDMLVAKALWLLAGFCGRTGREKEEESLLRRSLRIREAKLGPNSRTVSMTLHQLACCVWNTGRCEEGISLLRRALEIVEDKVGVAPDNPNVVHIRQQLERWVRETQGTE